MNTRFASLLLPLIIAGLTSCNDEQLSGYGKIDVEINYVPFKTERNLRIPYMLKTWEYEKQGLKLVRIEVIDDKTKAELMSLDEANLPVIFKGPLPASSEVEFTDIDHYYLSLQVPVPLTQTPPATISHRFILRDTLNNRDVTVEGGVFKPRLKESPRLISPPHKGQYWIFTNQSSNAYHFWYAVFVGGKIYTSEKFAFDTNQSNEKMENTYAGDPAVNDSYYNYADTIYAVASGTVVHLQDGRPENHGNLRDVQLTTSDEYCGNYLVIDIGGGAYSSYAHIKTNSFLVKNGDQVVEGQPIALLGNSGNSTEPHLHFQLQDGPDYFYSGGLPFEFRKYTRVGELFMAPFAPFVVTNANMENFVFAHFD